MKTTRVIAGVIVISHYKLLICKRQLNIASKIRYCVEKSIPVEGSILRHNY